MFVQHCFDACEGGQVSVLFFMPAAPNAAVGVSCAMLERDDEDDEDEVVVVVV